MKKSILLIALLSGLVSQCWADASFSPEQNQLLIPYARFQGQFYQADFSFLPPNKLKLEAISSQAEPGSPAEIVPIYDDLSFHLSQISLENTQYAADLSHLDGNIFQIHNLRKSLIAPPSRTIFRSKHFSGSGICAQCHNDIKDDAGKDVSIVTAWTTTMMANATRDPFWQAKVKSELNRTPSQQMVIQDTCSRCHAPMANEEAKKNVDSIQPIFGDGILSRQNPYHDLAMNGVSCSLCHQISPNEPFGTEAGFSGNFVINSYPTSTERLIYGPYENVLTRPMQNFANFTPVYSEHIKSSELCASCHDLTTPYTDEQGNILSTNAENEFPEQMPYSEWLHSDFSATDSCQQCHMPRSNGVTIASQPNGLKTKRDDFAQHGFLGSNVLMLSILQDYREPLGVTPKDFSSSIKNAQALLKGAAVIQLSDASLENDTLTFSLNIESQTGHKLPSGYPSRRVIVHVIVRDEQDRLVFETGKVNADGSVVGLDSDQNAGQYEAHYQLIESPDQVQVYEAVMQDYKNNITYTLLRAKSYKKDNRLLPLGFEKHKVPAKIKVRGKALLDEDFIGGSDTIQFALQGYKAGKYTVEAELIYQTLGYAFARDLFTDQAEEVSRFKQMFNASSMKSSSIGHTSLQVKAGL